MTVMHRKRVQSGPFPMSATVHKGIWLNEATVDKLGDFPAYCWHWVRNSDAESCRALAVHFEISFHFHSEGMGSKKCAYPFCQSSRKTHQRRSIIQLQGSSYNSKGPMVFYFFKVCSPPPCCICCLIFMLKVCTWHHGHFFHKLEKSHAIIKWSHRFAGKEKTKGGVNAVLNVPLSHFKTISGILSLDSHH